MTTVCAVRHALPQASRKASLSHLHSPLRTHLLPNLGEPRVRDVQLIDFDLCCTVVHDLPVADSGSSRCGSLGFMCPEALAKFVVHPTKTDVWGSACVLMELIMGREWFNNQWLRLYREFRPIFATAPDLPSTKTDFVNRLSQLVACVCAACEQQVSSLRTRAHSQLYVPAHTTLPHRNLGR